MSKLYVPEGVWLVCSEGTSTQQLTVVSQSMVKMDGDHLVATVEDKVKADFGCKKELYLPLSPWLFVRRLWQLPS